MTWSLSNSKRPKNSQKMVKIWSKIMIYILFSLTTFQQFYHRFFNFCRTAYSFLERIGIIQAQTKFIPDFWIDERKYQEKFMTSEVELKFLIQKVKLYCRGNLSFSARRIWIWCGFFIPRWKVFIILSCMCVC